jgi:Ca2+-dependent lipid-binding protein
MCHCLQSKSAWLEHAGLSDPFVKGTLSCKKFSTKIIWKTLNPKWDEKFELPIASWELPNLLLLHIFDKDRFHNDDLGFISLSLSLTLSSSHCSAVIFSFMQSLFPCQIGHGF